MKYRPKIEMLEMTTAKVLQTQMSIFLGNCLFFHSTIDFVNHNCVHMRLVHVATSTTCVQTSAVAKPLKFDWAFIWQIKTLYFFCSNISIYKYIFYYVYSASSAFSFMTGFSDLFGSQFCLFIYLFIFVCFVVDCQNGTVALVNNHQRYIFASIR